MDGRPLKLIARTPVDDDHRARLERLVRRAGALADAAGKELQSEFGKEHVALIVGCNQFLRVYRGGDHAGAVELWLTEEEKGVARDAGLVLDEAVGGAVFRMFGWAAVDPLGPEAVLDAALDAAFDRALAAGAPKGP